MNRELAELHAEALMETLGYAGRMISFSKSGFRERQPDHLAVFNANVCLAGGKVWHGDLDLTEDEPLLLDLASRLGETVFVLYELDARFKNEDQPLFEDAVYSVTPSGHSRFDFRYHERRPDGTLGERPPEPDTRRRWRLGVLGHRPRLLRFWCLELRRSHERCGAEEATTALLYCGARDGGVTPLLVLSCTRAARLQLLWLELTWYPAKGASGRSHAPRALIDLIPKVRIGRLQLWLRVLVWPGFTYEFLAGYRWRSHG